MLNNIVEVNRVCVNCGKFDEVKDADIYVEENCMCDGTEVRVMYYVCPVCGSNNAVQIDSEYTKSLLRHCRDVVFDSMNESKEDRARSDKAYKKASEKLRKARATLNRHLLGKDIVKKDGEILIKGLTIIQTDGKIKK